MSNFNKNKRNREILADWNEKNYTLNDLGQMHSITRERVRQILAKAKRLGLHVASRDEKSKMRKTSKLNSVLDKYKEDFIKLYSSKSPFEISKLLDLTQKQASVMEKLLIKSGEIKEAELPARLSVIIGIPSISVRIRPRLKPLIA